MRPDDGEERPPAFSDLLLRRARQMAQPVSADGEDGDGQLTVAEISLGDARYALPFCDVRAALSLDDVTVMPLGPPHVIGFLRWNGQAIAALSLASLLGVRGWRRDPAVLLVVACGGRLMAIDSEVVPKMRGLPRAAIAAARARGGEPVAEIATAQGEWVNLIDLNQLLISKGLG